MVLVVAWRVHGRQRVQGKALLLGMGLVVSSLFLQRMAQGRRVQLGRRGIGGLEVPPVNMICGVDLLQKIYVLREELP